MATVSEPRMVCPAKRAVSVAPMPKTCSPVATPMVVRFAAASGYYNGDFNYDGDINADDFALIDFNINAQGPAYPPSRCPAGAVAPVPEPGGWGLATLIALCSAARRRLRPCPDSVCKSHRGG